MTKKGDKQLVRGNSTYDMLIDIILNLTPRQAQLLYSELLPRYTTQGRVKTYNENLEEDPEGKVRLMPFQYKLIRTKYGDNYMRKAFKELYQYITYLEQNTSEPESKQKLKVYKSGTHNKHLTPPSGWVFKKCKAYILKDPPTMSINPFTIEDFETACSYITSIPKELWDSSLDIQSLLKRFPELNNLR